jgi:hypothetical protein
MLYSSGAVADSALQQTDTSPPLSTLVYRSRAVSPLSFEDLRRLMRAAQARNHREAVTGVMLHDDGRFFQWLEGPADGVERVMRSIRADPRHTDLDVLDRRPSSARRFDGWSMKLAARGAASARWNGEVLEPPPGIVENLRRRPAAAPDLLVKLVPPPPDRGRRQPVGRLAGGAGAGPLDGLRPEVRDPRGRHPEAAARPRPARGGAGHPAGQSPRSRARRAPGRLGPGGLAGPDQGAARPDGDARRLYAPLFEPAARSLGDLWGDDLCSEFDVTLGLCRLQTAVRLLGVDAPRAVFRGVQPNVLVAPAPGEPHQLAGALDTEWLWNAGWAPQFEFPADDRALADLVSATWIDVLDLSLSAAFRRAESLPRLARTIAQARRASRNPALVVVVGGRAFVEAGAAGPDVGADLASRTSRNVDRLMLQGMGMDTSGRPNRVAAQHR